MIRTALVFVALVSTGAVFASCGGVPGNAVATVDGEPIKKSDFTYYLNVAAKSGQPNAAVPDPESDYAKCVAAKRKATPAPAKGQPKVTDAQLKTQCKQEYEQLRNQVVQLLLGNRWIEGEAEAQGVTVTDAEVKKSFDTQKKQSFPKEEDYKKFLQTSGQTEPQLLKRIKVELLSNKIRDKVIKGKGTVSDAAIADFYNKNKAQFAQPEKRDLRVVLTKDKATADKARAALDSGDSWATVAKKYSIDDTSKAAGGKLPAQAKGTLDKELDTAVFSASKNELEGPIKTQYGYYVFAVTAITAASQQTLPEAKETIKQTLQSQNQQKVLDTFVKDFTKRWKDKTECSKDYTTSDCKNGPKATPTPTAPATDPTQQVPAETATPAATTGK
ncbi:peptidyl-prolyl cis-trans isomerase [Solirubrobacter ginsenosidimutans]|uniref:Peptidyl-prolyl cis-trans isomerase n=1 Tax=Solirubrobacter ginsenosidimutans TaxID=490573 RepID=A0A9X3MLX7_9ACTN|nr:peptidyl-prolyl cis-trans isomerase [Solirubrobacter ginsenosidimutans]MDA0158976.1 peptidyl-prolyl cis-trans isomerase [Solirubrobacter ginsenosidimutans]